MVYGSYIFINTGPATPGVPGESHGHSTFLGSKKKKGNQGKKERFLKQKLLKGCHQGQNVTVLAILECLEFKNFLVGRQYISVFHGPFTLKSISPAL